MKMSSSRTLKKGKKNFRLANICYSSVQKMLRKLHSVFIVSNCVNLFIKYMLHCLRWYNAFLFPDGMSYYNY
jgi:hypothetical protein